MEREIIAIFITCGVAIIVGIFAGSGAVYFFNRIPGKWLCDYGQEPSEELLHPTCQRVRSTPWKYVFTGFFIVAGIALGLDDPLFAVPAVAAMWLLLEMSIADIKYMIVPDQLIMLLVVCGVGFIPHHRTGVMDCLWGSLIGFGVMLVIAGLSKLVYKKPGVGGADVKLFAALGLCLGTTGVLVVFVLTTFISAAHFVYLMASRGAKLTDERAMVPYIAISATLYMVFLREMSYNIMIQF